MKRDFADALLPHQLRAVYGEMLNKQPLRYVLADDPGTGKTVMAGLLIKELLLRGDANVMVIAPGVLVDQWDEEMRDKFRLEFEVLTRDKILHEGNPFARGGLWLLAWTCCRATAKASSTAMTRPAPERSA